MKTHRKKGKLHKKSKKHTKNRTHKKNAIIKNNNKQNYNINLFNKIFYSVSNNKKGNNASYIPQLSKVNPNYFGVCIVDTKGSIIYKNGNYNTEFAIESISKIFTLAKSLSQNNITDLEKKIGLSGSPFPFNSIIATDQTETNTINPFVNAGAIATTCTIYDKLKSESKKHKNSSILDKKLKDLLLNNMSEYAGRKLKVGDKVYHSESETNAHNKSLTYLLKSKNRLSPSLTNEDLESCIDAYTFQCSVRVNVKDLAHMASVFANNGIEPTTNKRLIDINKCKYLRRAVQIGGLYEYSGLWYAKVGEYPAKSGVGGGIMIIVPGKFGIGIFSPKLDKYGNSVRGIEFGEKILNQI